MGFIKRVFPKSQKPVPVNISSLIPSSVRESTESLLEEESSSTDLTTTEITFDFHRLNVLLLRGVLKDGNLYGRKICTATMTEAKVHVTVSSKLDAEGSLGGLQVLDLTPEGNMHQRIVSLGRDPLVTTTHPLYLMNTYQQTEDTAFSFKVTRNLKESTDKDIADVNICMASLWYTHSPLFVIELQSCATEFKQYLANLARSIKSAATDMALGLVHARAEALAQSLSVNKRLPGSIYSSALSLSDIASPIRRKRRSSSSEHSGYASAKDTVPQTPYSPADEDEFVIDLKLTIEMESPVIILPKTNTSTHVFVGHLGKISVSNNYSNDHKNVYQFECVENRIEHYVIEVKDMNIYSLDTSSRRVPGQFGNRPDILYDCKTLAKPILHDTMLQLKIDREISKASITKDNSMSNLLLDDDYSNTNNYNTTNSAGFIQFSGTIVTPLKVSLTRSQYGQLLETLDWLTSSPKLSEVQAVSRVHAKPPTTLAGICEEDIGVTTLNMDPHIRAKLFTPHASQKLKTVSTMVSVKINFQVPVFTIQLRGETSCGEQGLIDLSFKDFIFVYEKCHRYETNVQISLKSILMEDLLQPEGNKQRAMVTSSDVGEPPLGSSCVSRSYPNMSYHSHWMRSNGSLPDHLETANVFGMNHYIFKNEECPCTPPPSPRGEKVRSKPEQNLVIVSMLIVDPDTPNFQENYNGIQNSSSIDFNCLDLIISVKSWVVLLDFFGTNHENMSASTVNLTASTDNTASGETKGHALTNITVKSLTVVLMHPDRDIAKANISSVELEIKTIGLLKEVDGRLGSMSLQDLTLHGQLYRERFLTTGEHVLEFKYVRYGIKLRFEVQR